MLDHLLESSNLRSHRDRKSVLVSLGLHAIVILALVIVPLLYYDALPDLELITFLRAPVQAAAPPPPPPNPTPPQPIERPVQQILVVDPDRFMVPEEIPTEIPPPDDALPSFSPLLNGTGIAMPEPGIVGMPDIGPVAAAPVIPPPPPPPRPRLVQPQRIGGDVLSSRLLVRVQPIYPDIAVRARVQGVVKLTIIVDERGQVTEIQNVAGNPLLKPAAVEAVRQWKYSPTLLNGEPVPVLATIDVHFKLRQ